MKHHSFLADAHALSCTGNDRSSVTDLEMKAPNLSDFDSFSTRSTKRVRNHLRQAAISISTISYVNSS